MRIVNKLCNVICSFKENGEVRPHRIKIEENDEYKVLEVKKIIYKDEEKINGAWIKSFTCQSEINGYERMFELRFNKSECLWYLWKM
ncbi:hypothetical protein [Clostridium sp. 'White wine YQ']|uniref:hypothetical protein n=1 Tax=Clostridium sp. 'White wine YQ' TaxID=3027474 RepID=UPI002365F89A|nr:hypothetical protein [Clostridium sp. 'White wine YQ']MDD7793705.1 hypothetical protein [Clostridium sp. 'White wine YQ']